MQSYNDHENVAVSVRSVAEASENARAGFITRTYLHLFGAIMAFTLIEVFIFSAELAEPMTMFVMSFGQGGWLVALGGFMVVSWLATHAAHRAQSPAVQYCALAVYVVAEALIFVPLLYMANRYAPGAIQSAALVTFLGFSALTGIAFYTRKDFSFLRGILTWAFVCALLAIVASVIFGFTLGMGFSVIMIAVAGGAILYDTSNILHHYSEDMHVAASLELFASVALMFWYVLRLFSSLED